MLRVAVGPPGGEDLKLVQILVQQFARERSSVRLRLVSREGPAQSSAAIDSGEADLAIVRGDLGMPKNGQVVAILRKNVAVLVVPPASPSAEDEARPDKEKTSPAAAKSSKTTKRGKLSKTKTKAKAKAKSKAKDDEEEDDAKPGAASAGKVEELIGKRIGVGGREDFNIRILRALLRQYDIPVEKVTVVALGPNEITSAVRERKVDALLITGPIGSPRLAEVVALASSGREGPRFIDIGEAEALAQRSPNYEAAEIVSGTFGGSPPRPPDKVNTIGFSHYIVARKGLHEQTVYDFTRLLFGARQLLAAESQAFGKIQVPDTDKDAVIPVHPGAMAYIEGDLKTFFDRYGDLMYWGIMLLSFLGSGAAGVASYVKSGERERSDQHLHRLVGILPEIRKADAERLDQLEDEVDAILTAAIQQAEGDALNPKELAAFTLGLSQTRFAIEQRRAALSGEPARKRPGRSESIALV